MSIEALALLGLALLAYGVMFWMKHGLVARFVAIAAWAFIVGLVGLIFVGDQVAPCLGLGNDPECVAVWEAAHPRPPEVLDVTRPWPWFALFVVGVVANVAIGRRRASR